MERTSDYRVKLKSDIGKAFEAIDSTGTFAGCGTLPTTPPACLLVEGVGAVNLPLSEKLIRQLIAISHQAPSSRGKKRSVDGKRLGGIIWEIKAARMEFLDPAWQGYLLNISQLVATKLGLSVPIRLQLDKMIIYEKGASSQPETEGVISSHDKIRGIFGTMLLSLPSTYTGGEDVVKHNGQSMAMGKSDAAQSFTCWFSDVTHQVLPVQSGYRCVLRYRLGVRPNVPRPTAGALDLKGVPLRNTLQYWHQNLAKTNLGEKSNVPSHLYGSFNNQSPRGTTASSATKGTTASNAGPKNSATASSEPPPLTAHDLAWVRRLQGYTRGLPFEIFLAFLEKAESGHVTHTRDHHGCWYDDLYSDNMSDSYELRDVEETILTVRSLSGLDGSIIVQDYKFDLDSCLQDNPFQNVVPLEDYDGESATNRYHQWSFVIIPHKTIGEYLAQAVYGFKYDLGTWASTFDRERFNKTFKDGEESQGSKDYDSALRYLGNITSLPSAQTSMLDEMCVLYVSQPSEKLQMTCILKSALQHSHCTLFQTVGVRHQGHLPLSFFDWAKEWLSQLSPEDRDQKYRTWIPLLIRGYPSVADIIKIVHTMSNSKNDAGGPADAKIQSPSGWAQDVIHPCIRNFPQNVKQPTTSDGRLIVTAIFHLNQEWSYKSALLTYLVDSFPQNDATAFFLAFLHALKMKATAVQPPNPIAELYRSLILAVFSHQRKLSNVITNAKIKSDWSVFLSPPRNARKDRDETGLVVSPEALVELVCDLIEMNTDQAQVLEPFIQEVIAQCDAFSAQDMQQLWMPFLCQLVPALVSRSVSLDTPIYQQLTRRFIRHLDDEAVRSAPKTVVIPPTKITCACADCVTLVRFLQDDKQRVYEFRMAKAKRQHVEAELKSHHICCTLKTIQTGSPHILVVTKSSPSLEKISGLKRRQGRLYAVFAPKIQQEHLQSLLGHNEASRILSAVKLAAQAPVPTPTTAAPPRLRTSLLGRNSLPCMLGRNPFPRRRSLFPYF